MQWNALHYYILCLITVPDLIDEEEMEDFQDGLGDDDAWEECDEEAMMSQDAQCLFCSEKQRSPEETFQHCNRIHGFNIVAVQRLFSLDTYGYIKMINFIRLKVKKILIEHLELI